MSQRVDKPSHSVSVLRAGAHECQIRSAKVAVCHRLQRFSFTLKRRQRAKFHLVLCLQIVEKLMFLYNLFYFHHNYDR
ncbi:hypothetical protein FZC69_15490 [Bacillus altitudinis]|nr:hypothetical protein FZC69_15490 [Bacillus altitudinis]